MKRILLTVLLLAVVAPALTGLAGCRSDSDTSDSSRITNPAD